MSEPRRAAANPAGAWGQCLLRGQHPACSPPPRPHFCHCVLDGASWCWGAGCQEAFRAQLSGLNWLLLLLPGALRERERGRRNTNPPLPWCLILKLTQRLSSDPPAPHTQLSVRAGVGGGIRVERLGKVDGGGWKEGVRNGRGRHERLRESGGGRGGWRWRQEVFLFLLALPGPVSLTLTLLISLTR